MSLLKEFTVVRVVRLRRPVEEYDGWRINVRGPQVGDQGTIVDVLHAENLPDRYVVESGLPDGTDLWLSDFDADEIEPVTEPGT